MLRWDRGCGRVAMGPAPTASRGLCRDLRPCTGRGFSVGWDTMRAQHLTPSAQRPATGDRVSASTVRRSLPAGLRAAVRGVGEGTGEGVGASEGVGRGA